MIVPAVPPVPRPIGAPPKPLAPTAPRASVTIGAVPPPGGDRVVIYGPGGIGKTTLAANYPGRTVFIDLDESLPKLTNLPKVQVVGGVLTFDALRNALQAPGWEGVDCIVIDTATKAEELAVAWTLANTLMEGGKTSPSVEGYGYGKGYGYVFDTFLPLLADLDRHVRAGRTVVMLCHDCMANYPNPQGEDWQRYEPRLQSPNSGKASIRLRVREWADHVLFIGYDVSVTEKGKGKGSGSRTIWPTELPHCMAKSRAMRDPVGLADNAAEVWAAILNK